MDYDDITMRVNPFDQDFTNDKVKIEMEKLQNELGNLGDEMATGKTPKQIAQEYEGKNRVKKHRIA